MSRNIQNHEKKSNNQIALQNGQNVEQKKKIIINEYNGDILNDIKCYLNQYLQSLNNIQQIPNSALHQSKQMMDDILQLVNNAMDKINFLQQNFNQDQFEDPTKPNQQKIDNSQTPQNQGDQGVLNSQMSLIHGSKVELQSENKQIQQINQINEIPNQECLINHKYAQDHLQDYQIILHLLLEQNLKNNQKSLKCFCNVNIKKSHLTILSNQHFFDLLLNQQQEMIFKTLPQNLKVLNCINNFCSFKCIGKVNNMDRGGQKFYCFLCDEYSIA